MHNNWTQLTPFFPGSEKMRGLGTDAERIVELSGSLASAAHPSVLEQFKDLTRVLNAYYSNKIEGLCAQPADIDRALRGEYSATPAVAKRQHLAVAHIETEKLLEKVAEGTLALTMDAVLAAHRSLYEQLPEADRHTDEGNVITPGVARRHDVVVGRHTPPTWESLPGFFEAWERHYCKENPGKGWLILASACAHHRLAWIHPFLDGNGRTARLVTHAALLPITRGLWAMNRGFAQDHGAYYRGLAAADSPRQGDLDGRGNLSERGLMSWCTTFLRVCQEQVDFQSKLLDPDSIKARIGALVKILEAQGKGARPEAAVPLFHLFRFGPMAQADFAQMTGLNESAARKLVTDLIKENVIQRECGGQVRFHFTLQHLQYLLPGLYPEAVSESVGK